MKAKKELSTIFHYSISSVAARAEDHIVAVCGVTGISFKLELAGLAKINGLRPLQYTCPLAQVSTVRQILKEAKLESLSQEILAGMTLSLYKNLGLLVQHKLTALEANSLLAACSQDSLLYALKLGSLVDPVRARSLPKLSLEIPSSSITNSLTFTGFLLEWLKLVAASIPNFDRDKGEPSIQVKKVQVQARKLAKYEVPEDRSEAFLEAEEKFIESKKEGKELLDSIVASGIVKNPKLVEYCKMILKGKNLISCAESIRTKVCAALKQVPLAEAQELATIIEEAADPYSLLDDLEDHSIFDSVPNLNNKKPHNGKLDIASILAARKARQ